MRNQGCKGVRMGNGNTQPTPEDRNFLTVHHHRTRVRSGIRVRNRDPGPSPRPCPCPPLTDA